MPRYFVYFLDGPCRGQHRTIDVPGPPAEITCRGQHYVMDVPRSEGAALTYATPERAIADQTPEEVAGKRNVYKAWNRLMRAATHGLGRELRKTQRARQRIRRAVR